VAWQSAKSRQYISKIQLPEKSDPFDKTPMHIQEFANRVEYHQTGIPTRSGSMIRLSYPFSITHETNSILSWLRKLLVFHPDFIHAHLP
jgi:hypothetical protein